MEEKHLNSRWFVASAAVLVIFSLGMDFAWLQKHPLAPDHFSQPANFHPDQHRHHHDGVAPHWQHQN